MEKKMTRRAPLKDFVKRDKLLAVPGVFDLISAKIADQMGFPVLYMTGYGTVASYLGLPDAGLATYTDMVDRVATICAHTNALLIADGDTGYGGLLNVRHSVRGYEAAGAAAIQLEDQEFPKKCGHIEGRRVVPTETMVRKIQVAVEARSNPDFLIIARTDARTSLGLEDALRRGKAYAAAGADVLFIESPESEAEMREICRNFEVPLLANMVEGGRTPVLSAERLAELGYSIALFPATGFLTAAAALRAAYRTLRDRGSSIGLDVPVYDFKEFSALMGFRDVMEFERAHPEV
jgi:2-methylisocitrate lyase-like PEP mutase family enzyme